ncbi:hypothetical protein DL98DRAFT_658139 [Cadophora sp. DSE1049]|nr:hypothetical protein DL98DRAFT_658139 [Cadophora sp. DSE1049]
MATLALNSMTQPCGRVCGIDNRYRTYLRSSPIICVLDIIMMLSRFPHLIIKRRIPAKKSARLTIMERFDDDSPVEGIQVLGSTVWIRWLLFMMGPLPQAIRLASFQGVFWSKVLGFGFLVPWLIMELMILISVKMARISSTIASAPAVVESRPQPIWMTYLAGLSIGIFTLELNLMVYFGLTQDRDSVITHVGIGLVYILLFLMSTVLFKQGIAEGVGGLCSAFPWLGRNLLVVYPVDGTEDLEVDPAAAYYLGCFWVNFWLLFVGYSCIYDSAGTANPGWTGVFG